MKTLLSQHSCRTLRLESSVQLLYLGYTEPAIVYKTEKIYDLLSFDVETFLFLNKVPVLQCFERNIFTFSTDTSKGIDSVIQQ